MQAIADRDDPGVAQPLDRRARARLERGGERQRTSAQLVDERQIGVEDLLRAIAAAIIASSPTSASSRRPRADMFAGSATRSISPSGAM